MDFALASLMLLAASGTAESAGVDARLPSPSRREIPSLTSVGKLMMRRVKSMIDVEVHEGLRLRPNQLRYVTKTDSSEVELLVKWRLSGADARLTVRM